MHEAHEHGLLDTNVVVYFIAGVPAELAAGARALVERAGEHMLLVVPALVVAECVWVLESKAFGHRPAEVAATLQSFLSLPGIVCPEWDVVVEALAIHADGGADFVDAYLAAAAAVRGPRRVFTRNTRDFQRSGIHLPDWWSAAGHAAPRDGAGPV